MADTEQLPVDLTTVGMRWRILVALKLRTPPDHEWAVLFRTLVSDEVRGQHELQGGWQPTDSLGILTLLENEARHHGLLTDDNAGTLAQSLAGALANIGRPRAR